ncbi:CU044_2847 family protein [Actinomadura sp. WMMA1423]|uniref:CU044_2847 family protein n=1 Tax=Actinomadura sp. WMMA1423 TaxID=2591108 RepID=UPI001146E5AA|nr:CU044_2847 family protein [Actinomadura sp. WMMA1423]
MTMIEAVAGDGAVLVEVSPAFGSERTSVDGRVRERADQAIRHANRTVTRLASELTNTVQAMPEADRPQDVTMEFGINFTAEGNAAIAKAGAQATLKITLTYRFPDPAPR